VQYGGTLELDPPAPEDEDNIMAALTQSDRVISINLTITTALQERLLTIGSPLSELESLVLLSRDTIQILPSAFWSWPCGTRLRSLHLTRIFVSALHQLLSCSKNLVDLRLHEICYPLNFSAKALTNLLSGMAQLRSLSLHFPQARFTDHSTSRERVTLPSLTRFDFRGIIADLHGLVAGIDAPRLGDIEVTFHNEPISDLSVLVEFIDRIKMYESPSRADILSSEHDITISLTQPGAPTSMKLKLLCQPLIIQLCSLARICFQFSAFLFKVEDLRINAMRPSRQEDSIYGEQWLEPIDSFKGVKWLRVSGNLSRNVVSSLDLRTQDRLPVLPALRKLHVLQPESRHAPLREAVVSFMTSRQRSGHPIVVEYEPTLLVGELVRGSGAGTVYNQCQGHYLLICSQTTSF
jgi:hypothetical protein